MENLLTNLKVKSKPVDAQLAAVADYASELEKKLESQETDHAEALKSAKTEAAKISDALTDKINELNADLVAEKAKTGNVQSALKKANARVQKMQKRAEKSNQKPTVEIEGETFQINAKKVNFNRKIYTCEELELEENEQVVLDIYKLGGDTITKLDD